MTSHAAPTTIVFFSATGGEIALLGPAAAACGVPGLRVRAFSGGQVRDDADTFVRACVAADAVIVSLHGGAASCPAWEPLAAALRDARARHRAPRVHVQPAGGDDDAVFAASDISDGLADGSWAALVRLLDAGGVDNVAAALTVLARPAAGDAVDVPEPQAVPTQGVYRPGVGHLADADTSPAVLPSARGEAPVVGLLFPQTYVVERNVAHVDALVEALESLGAATIPVFCHRFRDAARGHAGTERAVATYFRHPDGSPRVDVVVNLQGMSMTVVDPGSTQVYPDLGVPVLHAMTSSASYADWDATAQGASTMDVTMQAAQPEFDGALITQLVATREEDHGDEATGGLLPRLQPIDAHVASMARLALNWARLRRTPPHQRRVAVVFHHHPPRSDRIGCASGLDTFESVRLLLRALRRQGYDVGDAFATGDDLAEAMLAGLTCDRRFLAPEAMHARALAHVDAATARAWHADLPARPGAAVEDSWGPAPGELFVHEGDTSVAGHRRGNVLLTIQPPRGAIEKASEEGVHDPVLPPPHHYLTHYRWIRDVFGAHAVIHVGTHGSLEWLPGKALGLSPECYPQLALAELPNIYPYIVNNPGEGTQAKRRSACALVDHLTPPMRAARLYDESALVDRLVREYAEARASSPQPRADIAALLWDALVAADLHVDLDLDRESALADPDDLAQRVRHYLLDLADNEIADGLHVLGRVASDGGRASVDEQEGLGPRARVVEYLAQLVRLPNGDVPSLREAVLHAWGHDLDDLLTDPGAPLPGAGGRTGADVVVDAHEACLALLDAVYDLDPAGPADQVAAAVERVVAGQLGAPHPGAQEALTYVVTDLLPRLERVGDEVDAMVGALAGGFVTPGPSGAPTRGNADILPTGRNFYSLDPRIMPTPAAWRVGVDLAEDLLARYAAGVAPGESRYPRNVGMVLWGTANMRTRGEDVAEILHLLGLRPIWAEGGRVTGLEVVSTGELGRPRIDVTPRISGFFRDAFPHLVELLDEAVALVAALAEPEDRNLVRAHVLADSARHRAEGLPEDEAWRLATLRVFGCAPGTYGAGVEELIEAKAWETKEDLAAAYVRASAHAYGRGRYGDAAPQALRANLARMDATVKNEDTREYDMLSCTDFYTYHGGLIAAATIERGDAPASFVGDSSDPRRARTRTTAQEARLVLRSRLLNPTWISGLQRHGYKGAGDLSKVLDILLGWDATADVVDDEMFERIARRYALDSDMQEWFGQVNPYALHNILDTLLEAIQRGLWDAADATRTELEEAYLMAEGDIEDATDSVDADDAAPAGLGARR